MAGRVWFKPSMYRLYAGLDGVTMFPVAAGLRKDLAEEAVRIAACGLEPIFMKVGDE